MKVTVIQFEPIREMESLTFQTKSVTSLIFMLLLTLITPFSTIAAQANEGARLDQKLIHSDYNEGNFEKVTATLERFMSHNKTYSQEDSVFIAKHLAVVYSANPETREKGKYYMYRLLNLLPSAKLIDMYVSDEIDRIFDKVREEFLSRQKSFGVDASQITMPSKSPSDKNVSPAEAPKQAAAKAFPSPSKPQTAIEKSHTGYFIVGGAALIAASVTSYFIFSDSPKKTETIYEIP